MMLTISIATLPIIIIIITTLNLLLTHKKGSLLPLPPGPPGLLFIGNLHHFITQNLHVHLYQLANRYGPIMHMKLGSKPTLIISSAELAKQVLKTHDSTFCSRPTLISQQKLSYNNLDIAFSPYNDQWKEAKKIATFHLLSPTKVQCFRPIREDEIRRMLQRVSDSAFSGRAVDIADVARTLFSTLIYRTAVGKRYNDEEAKRYSGLVNEAQAMLVAFFVSNYFPWLRWVDNLTGMTRRLEVIFTNLDAFYQELIDEHLDPKREHKSDEENDILDVLIKLRKDNSSSLDLNWDRIKALLMDIFVGGTETSAATVVWTMMSLMKAPRVMKKLQAEIRGTVGLKAQVDEDDVPKLPYLKAVISESFRMYPPSPLPVPRESIKKCIIEGYEIPPKTTVYFNTWAIGRDPEYWENPHEFWPERFLDGKVDVKGQDFGVIPFGSGRRICPGMAMGLVNVEITLANLLYSFDWNFPHGVSPQDVDEDSVPGVAAHKKNPLLLVPQKFTI